jgi:hypothetical protein
MRRTLIVLHGKRDSGKTTTMRRAYDQIVELDGVKVLRKPPRQTNLRGTILEFDGVRIGFVSVAEPPEGFLEYLTDLIRRGCQVIICATRSRGRTRSVVARFGRKFRIVETEKERMSVVNRVRDDEEKATEIIRQIKKAIKKTQLVEA